MLSETLTEGLSAYKIGAKLRHLRLKKKMGLVDLGKHTGLSPALLSKIETARLFPTLPTLLRISLVFGVSLEHFFAKDVAGSRVSVVRRTERRRFPSDPSGKAVAYHFESLDFSTTDRKLSAYYAEFEPIEPASVRPHSHPGVESLYVIRGRLVLSFEGEEHLLETGDSVYFDSTQPHGYRRKGASTCAALVVAVP